MPDDSAVMSDLPHGWNYGDAIRFARIIAASYRWVGFSGVSFGDAYTAAYDGVVAHLFNADEPPSRSELFRRGAAAIRSIVATSYRDVGRPLGPANGANFRAYWYFQQMSGPDHGPRVAEQLAVWQVFEGLDEEDRETLTLLANHLDGRKVREATGWGGAQYDRRLKKARENFYRLWFEGETPPELPRRVVVSIPQRAADTYTTSGYLVKRQQKSGVRYYARIRHQGKVRHVGVYKTRDEGLAAIERAKANLVLDQFESDHRKEQPGPQQSVRADVGDSPLARMA